MLRWKDRNPWRKNSFRRHGPGAGTSPLVELARRQEDGPSRLPIGCAGTVRRRCGGGGAGRRRRVFLRSCQGLFLRRLLAEQSVDVHPELREEAGASALVDVD